MARKEQPSLEMKKLIWSIAAQVGKDKLTEIQRQIDIEIRKPSMEDMIIGDTPDTRTIDKILNQDIYNIPYEVFIKEFPQQIWKLRVTDYLTLINYDVASKVRQITTTDAADYIRNHDRIIFQGADLLINDEDFITLFIDLEMGECTLNQYDSSGDYQFYFNEYPSHKYKTTGIQDALNIFLALLGKLEDEMSYISGAWDKSYMTKEQLSELIKVTKAAYQHYRDAVINLLGI